MTNQIKPGITAEELMKFNWLLMANCTNPVYLQIAGLLEDFAYAIKPDGRKVLIKYGRLSGIPLTPEILERCGFKYQKSGIGGQDMWAGMGWWYFGEFQMIGDKTAKDLYFQRNWDWRISTVHQLQNLYFALCGTQLIINP